MRQARAAVARGDFAEALSPINEHTRRFRNGRLVEEREALRVKALVGLRRNDPLAWSRMRAPLASLGESDVRKLGAAIDGIRSRRAA